MTTYRVDLSHPEDTSAGVFLGMLYSNGWIDKLIPAEKRYGKPYWGGHHILILTMTEEEIKKFSLTVRSKFANTNGSKEFFMFVKRTLYTEKSIEKNLEVIKKSLDAKSVIRLT